MTFTDYENNILVAVAFLATKSNDLKSAVAQKAQLFALVPMKSEFVPVTVDGLVARTIQEEYVGYTTVDQRIPDFSNGYNNVTWRIVETQVQTILTRDVVIQELGRVIQNVEVMVPDMGQIATNQLNGNRIYNTAAAAYAAAENALNAAIAESSAYNNIVITGASGEFIGTVSQLKSAVTVFSSDVKIVLDEIEALSTNINANVLSSVVDIDEAMTASLVDLQLIVSQNIASTDAMLEQAFSTTNTSLVRSLDATALLAENALNPSLSNAVSATARSAKESLNFAFGSGDDSEAVYTDRTSKDIQVVAGVSGSWFDNG